MMIDNDAIFADSSENNPAPKANSIIPIKQLDRSLGKGFGINLSKNFGFTKCIIPAKQKNIPYTIFKAKIKS